MTKALSVPATVEATALAPPEVVGLDLAQAFRRHHTFVWRTLACMGIDPALVDDAVQDVFMTAHRRRADYDPQWPERRWLYGIARMTARNYRRKAARRRTHALSPDLDAGHDGAEQHITRREVLQRVQGLLRGLPRGQREVFVLSQVHGLSAPEIGEILAVKVNTIYSRLRLAKLRFEKAVADQQAETPRKGQPWNA